MSRLIDADIMRANWLYNGLNEYDVYDINYILNSIDEQPTIDAVPVVRCKDCKYYVSYWDEKEKFCDIFCDGHEEPYPTKPTDFCSYGERKEEEE